MKKPIYLDNHSTTPLDPQVLDAMMPFLTEQFGNASSKGHSYGWIAEEAANYARENIAKFINSDANEIIFTSGTTESNNLILKGLVESYGFTKNQIITTSVEHASILEALKYLENKGIDVIYLPVDKYGCINLNHLKDSLTEKTLLVSIMAANNEIGTIYPLKEIGQICKEKNILFHSDAAQAIGKIEINVREMNIDFLSFSAHKNYGPKGIGALYLKKNKKIKITPLFHGGKQEYNLRSGTLNIPGIVGFGKSLQISSEKMNEEYTRIKGLRNKLFNGISSQIDNVCLNGHPEDRLPNNLNISFSNVNIDNLLMEIREIAVSTGSACASGSDRPSHVLTAIGLDPDHLRCSLRFGIGRFNTDEEIELTIDKIVKAVNKIRNITNVFLN